MQLDCWDFNWRFRCVMLSSVSSGQCSLELHQAEMVNSLLSNTCPDFISFSYSSAPTTSPETFPWGVFTPWCHMRARHVPLKLGCEMFKSNYKLMSLYSGLFVRHQWLLSLLFWPIQDMCRMSFGQFTESGSEELAHLLCRCFSSGCFIIYRSMYSSCQCGVLIMFFMFLHWHTTPLLREFTVHSRWHCSAALVLTYQQAEPTAYHVPVLCLNVWHRATLL